MNIEFKLEKKLNLEKLKFLILIENIFLNLPPLMPDGVIGNTSDSGSEESRFETWSGN